MPKALAQSIWLGAGSNAFDARSGVIGQERKRCRV
jgi:hypothetical protein